MRIMILTKGNGGLVNVWVRVFIGILMGMFMMGSGLMILNRVRGLWLWQLETSTKVTGRKGRRMDLECMFSLIRTSMKVSSRMATDKAKAHTDGQMGATIKAVGLQTK